MLIIFLIVGNSANAEKQTILLSYFDAFGGNDSNHSQKIAELVKMQMSTDPNLEIVLCPLQENKGLDVSFYSPRTDIVSDSGIAGPLKGNDSAYQQLSRCYANHPEAKQVISLGEGHCEMNVESSAYNTIRTADLESSRDKNGNLIPITQKIDKNGPDSVSTDDTNIIALCLEQTRLKHENNQERNLVQYSNNIGSYVCNNLAYNFQRKASSASPPISFSFIHVPMELSKFTQTQCNSDRYADALKAKGQAFNEKNFSALIASHVSGFIQDKATVLTELTPRMNNNYSKECGNTDILDSATKQNMKSLLVGLKDQNARQNPSLSDMRSCIDKKRKMRSESSNIFSSQYSE